MKKTGSNLISFPKLRRVEQTGFTHKGFPARWLGLLLMGTMGAAWALSPSADGVGGTYSDNQPQVNEVVFEGEPQVVAQLMGATVGAGDTPTAELRALSARGGSDRRVVVSTRGSESKASQDLAKALEAVENVESEFAASSSYPAICPTDKDLAQTSYETNGRRFRIKGDSWTYDSSKGLSCQEQEVETSRFGVAGSLSAITTGWGPWKSTNQEFSTLGRSSRDMSWLENAPVTPAWSARMYFPISQAHTGYAFRRADGSSPYKTGELLYDGVSGTFQLKLHRNNTGTTRRLCAERMEKELGSVGGGSELIGDAELIADLGFLKMPKKVDSVVQVSSPARVDLSSEGAMNGLSLSTFTRHKKRLKPANYLKGSDDNSSGSATVVGRLELVDKLGQVHSVRVRAGRGHQYDWVVGQLCPIESRSADVEVFETSAYEDAFEFRTASTVKAGE